MSNTPNSPRGRVFHAFVQDASARNHMFFASSDGNFETVQQEAQTLAAAPGARVIAYEQNEEEKMRDPLTLKTTTPAHRPSEPGEDDQDDGEPSDEVKGLVVELSRAMARLTISIAKNGLPKPVESKDTQPEASTAIPGGKTYRASAADVRAAQVAGAGKAVDEMNTRVLDGIEPLKEAGFDMPLRYEWDPISCRYRIT